METGNPWAAIRIPAGPETALSPMIGLMAATGARVCFSALTMPGTARIGPMLVIGIARSEQHDRGRHDGIDHAGSGFGFLNSGEADRIDRILIPALHKIFFEAQFADGRVHPGFHAGIAHGQNAGLDAHLRGDVGGNFGQSFTLLNNFVRSRWTARSRSPA